MISLSRENGGNKMYECMAVEGFRTTGSQNISIKLDYI